MLVVSSDHTAQRIAGGHGGDVLEDAGTGHSDAATLGIGTRSSMVTDGCCWCLGTARCSTRPSSIG